MRAEAILLPTLPQSLVGVWLQKVSDAQHHVGLCYFYEGKHRFLHLAWHHKLTDDEKIDKRRCYAPLSKHEDHQLVIAGFLAVVKDNAGLVPYGIDYESAEACIQPDGSLVCLPLGKGLTCATFVADVLRAAGYRLLDFSTWPERPSDAVWQNWVIQTMKSTGVDPEYIKYIEQDIGAKRLRPEEAAGACVTSPWPVSYSGVEEVAAKIIGDVEHFSTRT